MRRAVIDQTNATLSANSNAGSSERSGQRRQELKGKFSLEPILHMWDSLGFTLHLVLEKFIMLPVCARRLE